MSLPRLCHPLVCISFLCVTGMNFPKHKLSNLYFEGSGQSQRENLILWECESGTHLEFSQNDATPRPTYLATQDSLAWKKRLRFLSFFPLVCLGVPLLPLKN